MATDCDLRLSAVRYEAHDEDSMAAVWCDPSTPYTWITEDMVALFPGIVDALPWRLALVTKLGDGGAGMYRRVDMTSLHEGPVTGWQDVLGSPS